MCSSASKTPANMSAHASMKRRTTVKVVTANKKKGRLVPERKMKNLPSRDTSSGPAASHILDGFASTSGVGPSANVDADNEDEGLNVPQGKGKARKGYRKQVCLCLSLSLSLFGQSELI